ncbi:MAG: hypothetical protein R3293_24815 [Candidatus Promineifilaceae bacterium]|nr:hypothetical protein [Candidatus Promineifilaceae bacterium]
MSRRERLAEWVYGRLVGRERLAVRPNLMADEHWPERQARPHDRPQADMARQYLEALNAWRKNPMAWRMIQITTDYTVAGGIQISSPDPYMQRFIKAFWQHPENHIANRLEAMSDELARSGDLFPVLFRQRQNGVSLLRFLTKDQVLKIETAPNDWEREVAVIQKTADPTQPKKWRMPHDGKRFSQRAIALHYAVNRPIGAQFGESDLATVLPWLLRYSRMLEDRVRFHWATRLFLWFVQVPRNRVQEKAEQYRRPPEAGSVIVHDESESWETRSPALRGADAAPDMKAVRQMIDAGSGYPPHWRGEAADVNLATAQAMQEPAERHLARRQKYFTWMLSDLTYQAYVRASQLRPELWPMTAEANYEALFTITAPDVSRGDNVDLAQAADRLASAFDSINAQYPRSDTLRRILLKLLLNFAGETPTDETLDQILDESVETTNLANAQQHLPVPSANGTHEATHA